MHPSRGSSRFLDIRIVSRWDSPRQREPCPSNSGVKNEDRLVTYVPVNITYSVCSI